MNNILNHFNEKVINLTKKYLENSFLVNGISSFTEDLVKEFAEFGSNLTQYIIEYVEKQIFELEERKEQFESLEKDERNIISIFGDIHFKRRYYKNKLTNKKVYLLDEFIGIEPKQRLLTNVKEKLIDEAIDSSYEKAGEKAAYNTKISKQEVKNEIEKLNLDINFYKSNKERKKVETLYIIADEDYVHLQKGGIAQPRMIIVYENVIQKGKRIMLDKKRHFGGLYKNRIHDLWEEVALYIEDTYDIDYIQRVYIQGDGASWIKTGLEWIQKSIYVIDEFHMTKAINNIVGRIIKEKKKEKMNYKKRIYKALKVLDFVLFKDICYEIISEEMERTLRIRKEENMNYILNNIDGISNLYKNKEELHGCSAEGHISHIFSDRMSSRPMGWKSENVNNMSKLRLLKEDNITVKEILKKQEKIIKIEDYKEIKEKTQKKINKNIDFKPVSLPIITFGSKEEREYFKGIISEMAI